MTVYAALLHSIARQKSPVSINISLNRMFSTVQPSDVVNRVPPDRGKFVTLIAGSTKWRRLLIAGDERRSSTHQWILFMTESLEVTQRQQNRVNLYAFGKSEAEVTNNKRSCSMYCTVKTNYRQTYSIAQPLCDSRATYVSINQSLNQSIKNF